MVAIQDVFGNTVTSSTAPVTLAITPGTGTAGATLSGTSTVNAVNGVATFSSLSIDQAGSGYTLTVTSPGLTSATSASFTVAHGPASKLVFTTQPAYSVAEASLSTQPVVIAQDALGNTATSFSAVVTLAITPGSGTAGAVISGTTTVNAVNGVATFTNLNIDKAGSGYTITATTPGLTEAVSARSLSDDS